MRYVKLAFYLLFFAIRAVHRGFGRLTDWVAVAIDGVFDRLEARFGTVLGLVAAFVLFAVSAAFGTLIAASLL